jgi:hypothetical protein
VHRTALVHTRAHFQWRISQPSAADASLAIGAATMDPTAALVSLDVTHVSHCNIQLLVISLFFKGVLVLRR